MSSTPPPLLSTKKTPAKTPSQTWGNVLFGLLSTTKKHVEPSTDSTESRRRSSSKSNKNLERVNLEDNYNNINGDVASQFSNVSSPDAAAAVPGVSFGSSPLPLQQLQKDTTRPAIADQKILARRSNPWRSSSSHTTGRGNNTVQFDMGISKPTPSRDTTRRHGNNYTMSTSIIAPVNRRTRPGRNKYKPSISFGIGKRRNRGGNDIDVSAALKNVRSAIEPSNQKIQADNNYRNNIVCRPGSRLLDQQRSNGRLPDEQQHRENTNGKREIVNDDQYQSTTEVARKKRRVGFNEESNDSMPIENLVSTSTPSRTSNKHKRKATPYKSGADNGNFDDDDDDDEEMIGASKPIPTIASRDLVKAKRPASKTASKKYDSDDDEDKEEDFTIMPVTKDNLFMDYKNWSTSNEREKLGEPIVGDFTAPDCFMLKPPVSLADTPRYDPTHTLPQFRQLPLAERTDRTVPDEDDDCDDLQDTKRSKTETWKCDACGFANADDETHCQFVKVEENKQKNQREQKCLGGRKGKEPLGWGNTKFGAAIKQQQDRIKCISCGVFNEKSRSKCASCEVDLPTDGTGSTNGTSTATTTGSAAAAKSKVETAGSIGTQGFSFGGFPGGSTTTTTGAISSSGFSFGGSTAAVAVPSSTNTGGAISSSGFSFGGSTTAAPAPGAISSTGFSFGGSTAAAPAPAVLSSTAPSTTITSAGGFSFGSATTVPASSVTPVASTGGFQFGAATTVPAPVPASTTAPSSSPPASSVPAPVFNFGSSSTSAPPTTAPSSSTEPSTTVQSNGAATLFGNFAASSSSTASTAPAATTGFNNSVPSLGSVTTEGNDGSFKKKRRGRDDILTSFGTTSSSASSSNPLLDNGNNSSSTQAGPGMFGNLTSTAPSFQGGATTSAPASQPFVFGKSSTDSSNQNETSSSAAPVPAPAPIAFGNTLNNNSTVPAPDPLFPPASGSGLFGSAPAAPAPASSVPITFGSTPAVGPTFGSTGPAPATTSIQFGSTPAPALNPSFGSAVPFGSTTPAQSSTTFGSTPAPAQQPFANSTPVPGQQFGNGFGSTPAPAPAQPFGTNNASGGFNTSTTFGTAQPAGVSAPLPFGGTAPTPGMGGFGGGPSQTPGMGGFGDGGTTLTPTPGGFGGGGFGQQAPPQQQAQVGGFGNTTPNAQAGGQFSLGTGGNASNRGRTPGTGRRRILKARRPR